MYEAPPTTLPMYAKKEKLRYQVFFDTWKPLLKDLQVIQEAKITPARSCGVAQMVSWKILECN
jgi:hypothetical protein